jgi:hypothetical protein
MPEKAKKAGKLLLNIAKFGVINVTLYKSTLE